MIFRFLFLFLILIYCNSYSDQRLDGSVDHIVVEKMQYRLTLYDRDNRPLKVYAIALGFSPQGHKMQEGDGKTPEGRYIISNKNPQSRFHKSLKISYPNNEDRKVAASKHVSPGGDIMLHGIGSHGWLNSLHRSMNWTNGCIAVTNQEIDEIYENVQIGTEIIIKP